MGRLERFLVPQTREIEIGHVFFRILEDNHVLRQGYALLGCIIHIIALNGVCLHDDTFNVLNWVKWRWISTQGDKHWQSSTWNGSVIIDASIKTIQCIKNGVFGYLEEGYGGGGETIKLSSRKREKCNEFVDEQRLWVPIVYATQFYLGVWVEGQREKQNNLMDEVDSIFRHLNTFLNEVNFSPTGDDMFALG